MDIEKIVIRPATPEDLDGVAKLAAQLVRMHHAMDAQRFMLTEPVEEGYKWWLGRELQNAEALVLAAVDPTLGVIGYAYGRLEERSWNALLDAHGALHDIFVDERVRLHGVARRLLRDMLTWLEAHGAPRVVLSTAWHNTSAHALFKSVGFRPTMIEMTRERDAT